MNPLADPMVPPAEYLAREGMVLETQYEPGDWQCLLMGGENGITYRPPKGMEPNRFHRLMHWLVLGAKWRKKPPVTSTFRV